MARRLVIPVLSALVGFGAGGAIGSADDRGSAGGPPPASVPVSILSSRVPGVPSTLALLEASTVPPALPGWLAFVSAEPSPDPTAAPATTPPAPPTGPITYTVQPGDTLTAIARWFELHGYRDLYEANRAVIGNDPDLIFPGQTITVGSGVMVWGEAAPIG